MPEKLIDLNKVVAMGSDDFIKKLGENYRSGSPVIIYDEGGDYAARGALTKANAVLNRVFETYRAFKVIIIMTVPSFGTLDGHIFDKQIPRLLIHCYDRKKGFGSFKGYDLKGMLYLRDKMKKIVARPLAYNYIKPIFFGVFHDLSPERSKLLDEIGRKGKEHTLDQATKNEENTQGLMSYRDIAEALFITVAQVRKKIYRSDGKIRPVRYVGNAAYYEPSVVELLKRKGIGEIVRKKLHHNLENEDDEALT